MNNEKALTVGIIGLGNIGQEVARQLLVAGKGTVKWILDRTPEKQKKSEIINEIARIQGEVPKIIKSIDELADVEEVDSVIEATGDINAVNFLRKIRLVWEKRVTFITANKATVAKNQGEFFSNNKDVRMEASVAGGLPLIRSLSEHISADEFLGLAAILNGTTNYILERLSENDLNEKDQYDEALADAIKNGYAEPKGKGDVDGLDSGNKLLILARIAYGKEIDSDEVLRSDIVRGINAEEDCFDRVRYCDFWYARHSLRHTIKLISLTCPSFDEKQSKKPFFLVHPMLVPFNSKIAKIEGIDNYVNVLSKHLGYIDLQGKGAGPQPTACAILADVYSGKNSNSSLQMAGEKSNVQPSTEIYFTRWMVRACCYDKPGVLAALFDSLRQFGIGIDEVFQIQRDDKDFKKCKDLLGIPRDIRDWESIVPFAFTTTGVDLYTLRSALKKVFSEALNCKKEDCFFPKVRHLFAMYPILINATTEGEPKENGKDDGRGNAIIEKKRFFNMEPRPYPSVLCK